MTSPTVFEFSGTSEVSSYCDTKRKLSPHCHDPSSSHALMLSSSHVTLPLHNLRFIPSLLFPHISYLVTRSLLPSSYRLAAALYFQHDRTD
eukprot:768749-Hanusia_phi.AAC.30